MFVEENTQQVEEPKSTVTEIKFGDEGNGNQQAEQVNDTSNQEFDNTEYSSWDADKRYKDYWKEDPNNLYQTLRQEEKAKKNYQNQINDYQTQIESLKEYETNYKAVEDLFNDPNIGPKLSQVINEYQAGNQQAQSYNPNGVTDPNQQAFYQQLQPIQQQLQEMSNWKNDLMNAVNQHNAQQVQDQQFESIDKIADEHNVSYKKDDFIQSMQSRGIPVEHWAAQFAYEAWPQIKSNVVAQSSESALKNANETHSIAGQADKIAPSGEGQSFIEQLRAASYIPMS